MSPSKRRKRHDDVSRSVPSLDVSKADVLFDAQMKWLAEEGNAEVELIEIVTGTPYEEVKPEAIPFDHITYDYYDYSFEFKATDVLWDPDPEMLTKFWKLGFARCWICYTDGTERYYSKPDSISRGK